MDGAEIAVSQTAPRYDSVTHAPESKEVNLKP